MRLDQRHIGYMLSTRNLDQGQMISRSELRIELQRNGERLSVQSEETSIETTEGRPIGFSSRFETSGTVSRVEGTINSSGQLRAEIERAGKVDQLIMDWPASALLAEGQRLRLHDFLAGVDDQVEFIAFDTTSLRPLAVQTQRLHEALDRTAWSPLPDFPQGQAALLKQRMGRDGGTIENRMVLDLQTAEPLAMRLPALGLQLEFVDCGQACALAPPQTADVLDRTIIDSPRALSPDERLRGLRFEMEIEGSDGEALGVVPGQHLSGESDSPRLLIDPEGSALSPPTADDLKATRWLQSDDPAVRSLASETVEGRTRDDVRMLLLERRVREVISTKSLRIGYASAREALELKEGDCTEHAVLLAALARAANIPARVVTGLAYSARFGSRRHVFVPHAWVMAWIDGRWRGYDAALPRFDAAHIGLAAGQGDPFDFYAGLDLLGRMQISSIKPASRRELRAVREISR